MPAINSFDKFHLTPY